MRKLKKGFAVALAMAMTVSMVAGCGDKGKDVTGNLNKATQTLSLIHISEPTRPY